MLHLIKYRCISILRNYSLLFWTLGFPLVLMSFFSLVLSSAYDYHPYVTTPIAIVATKQYETDPILKDLVQNVKSEDTLLFDVQVLTEAEAEQKLLDGDVKAIVTYTDNVHINVMDQGLSQQIVQTFFDSYIQQKALVQTLMEKQATSGEIEALFQDTYDYIQPQSEENNRLDGVSLYTCLAMSALSGSQFMMLLLRDIMANQSAKGIRSLTSPTHKIKTLSSALLVSVAMQMLILIIQLLCLQFIFHVSFGDVLWPVYILLCAAAFAGNGLGVAITVVFYKCQYGTRQSIGTAITIFLSFLAGMMSLSIKMIVQMYIPILSWINPANLVTDGLYALYYYGVSQRFYLNLSALLIFSIICYSVGYFQLRKKQYDALEVRA